jgi:RNA polymerase sigma-70 factor, ECF subfamily
VTDAELVALAREGDTGAFDQLVTRHQAAAYRAALAALRNPADAEDVTQDAFVRAWQALPRFRGDAAFRTWLLTIVWKRALTRRRSLVRWWQRSAPLDDAQAIADGGAVVPNRELHRETVAAIQALSASLRDTLLLAQSGEYDYGAIAAMLKVPVGTIKWRVAEARKKVRQRLARLGYVDVG